MSPKGNQITKRVVYKGKKIYTVRGAMGTSQDMMQTETHTQQATEMIPAIN